LKVKPPLLHKRKWQDSVLDCNYILLTNLQTSCVYSISRRANPQIGYCSPPKVPSHPFNPTHIRGTSHRDFTLRSAFWECGHLKPQERKHNEFCPKNSHGRVYCQRREGKSRATEERQREDRKLCRNQEWRPQVRLRVDFVCR